MICESAFVVSIECLAVVEGSYVSNMNNIQAVNSLPSLVLLSDVSSWSNKRSLLASTIDRRL
jgi:hypothetical protein